MDNHYVPNLTIGPLVCEALRKHGVTAPIDVHLMVKPVDRIVPDFAARRRHLHHLSPRGERSRRSHHRADPRERLQARAGVQSGDAARLARSRARQAGHGVADVGQPGLRRPEVHPAAAGEAGGGAQAHRCERPRGAAGDRRRREGRQHRRDRAGRRGHVRGGLGDLRQRRLRARRSAAMREEIAKAARGQNSG